MQERNNHNDSREIITKQKGKNRMAKKEIKYDQVPQIIKDVQDELICKVGYGGLGFPAGTPYVDKTDVEGEVNYLFEYDPAKIEYAEDGLGRTMLIFQMKVDENPVDPEFDADYSIMGIYFRLYGRNINSYIEIAAEVIYINPWKDDDTWSIGELEWRIEQNPRKVSIVLNGQEEFCWDVNLNAPDVLKEIFDEDNCTMTTILRRFSEIIMSEYWEPLEIKWRESNVNAFLQRIADMFNVEILEKEGINDDEKIDEEEYSEYHINLRKYAKCINSGDFRIESAVLDQVMRELIPWCRIHEKAEEYKKGSEEYKQELKKLNLPNLAFLGEPGTGKTELAKRLAENLLGAEFMPITGTALKGVYLGSTRGEVASKFKELKDQAGKWKPAVLFIDEAYVLFNGKDEFGSEVIEILLKALEPGERIIKAKKAVSSTHEEAIQVVLPEHMAVWFGGYEKDMRKALSANRGMYRRVRIITLPVPKIDALWKQFQTCVKHDEALPDEKIRMDNWKLCNTMRKDIYKYFSWARSKTYAEFFGNYAGAKRLAEEIGKRSLLKGRAIDKWSHDLEEIIEGQKAEIRTQYQQVIEDRYERLPFMVYTDVEETFDKYIGAEGTKEKLRHVLDMICSPETFPGCDSPKGALLVGSPGTGKTFLARCMAGELRKALRDKSSQKDVAFVKVAATELHTEELVKALFCVSSSYDYVIIFIDEIDAIGRRREMLSNPSVLIQLMNELDGFEGKKNVFVLAATNAPEVLDAALVRPGRFDMSIEVGVPNDEDRRKMVKHYIGWEKCSEDLLSDIVRHFRGCSPVQIKTILNEAKILYYDCEQTIRRSEAVKVWFAHRVVRGSNPDPKEGAAWVTLEGGKKVWVAAKDDTKDYTKDGVCESLFLMDFFEVLARRMVGERTGLDKKPKGFSPERNDNGLSATAIHEVGHALVSVLRGSNIEKITILERGDLLGYVSQDVEVKLTTKQDYMNRLDICFGGRAAEEIIYGPEYVSSGASRDIQTASRLARYMIMQLGMNEKVGPVALETASGRYLDGSNQMLCTESTMTMAESEVRKLLKERYSATLETLRPHGELLKKLAEYVFEKEEVSGEDFAKLVEEIRESLK